MSRECRRHSGESQGSLKICKKENLWLNPDCGYATFSNRPVNTYGNIENKIKTWLQQQGY